MGTGNGGDHRPEEGTGIEEDIRDALLGHANARIGREYGTGYGDPRLLYRLVEAMNKIPVPRELYGP